MTLTLIFLLIAIGIFLIWLEFFIVPGITVAGIGGTVLVLGGIYYAYAENDGNLGHYVLIGTVLLTSIFFYLSFRSNTWKKTSLDTTIDGQIDGINLEKIKVGDVATSISRLAPMGKIMIGEEIIEAKSKFGLIDENQKVTVLEIYSTNVLVELYKQENA